MSALDKYLDSEEHEGGVVEEKENNNIDADTEGEIIDSLTAVKVSDYVEGACVECEVNRYSLHNTTYNSFNAIIIFFKKF